MLLLFFICVVVAIFTTTIFLKKTLNESAIKSLLTLKHLQGNLKQYGYSLYITRAVNGKHRLCLKRPSDGMFRTIEARVALRYIVKRDYHTLYQLQVTSKVIKRELFLLSNENRESFIIKVDYGTGPF